MSKRTRWEAEDDVDYSEQEGTPGVDVTMPSSGVVSSLLRMILTRSAKNQKIRKEHFTPILHKYHIKGNTKPYILEVSKELEDVFGLKLVQNATDMVLTSSLEKETKLLLQELLQDNDDADTLKGNPYDLFYFMNQNTRREMTVSTQETLFGGIVMLVLGLVIISENRIREGDLLDALGQFGFSENMNIVIPNLNKTTQEFLNDVAKREYLEKEVAEARAGEPAIVNYRLGKRALREFDPSTMLEFLREIVPQDEMRRKCIETIKRCFPDDYTEPEETEAAETEAIET